MFRDMAKVVNLGDVRARRKAIQAETAAFQHRIEELLEEDRELDIAERVLMRLTARAQADAEADEAGIGLELELAPPTDTKLAKMAALVSARVDELHAKDAAAKPINIPAMPDMIREALKHAVDRGVHGLTPAEMLAYIRNKYWPEATTNKVGPIAWRMHRRNQLLKRGQVYRLPREPEKRSAESANFSEAKTNM
jgi:hypothetical protein